MSERPTAPQIIAEIESEVPPRARIRGQVVVLAIGLAGAGYLRFDTDHPTLGRLLVLALALALVGRFQAWLGGILERRAGALDTASAQSDLHSWILAAKRQQDSILRERGRGYFLRTRLGVVSVPLALLLYAALVLGAPNVQVSAPALSAVPRCLVWGALAIGLSLCVGLVLLLTIWGRAARLWAKAGEEAPPT